MRWTCPKCGKKLDVSNEQLIANDGVIVCPQCLLQAHQPIPKARVSERSNDTSSKPATQRKSAETIDFDTPPEYKPNTPPPYQPRMKQASTSYRYTGMSGNKGNTSNTPKRKSSGKKKSKKKKNNDGMSAWGCLGRTIIFTLVLFAAYIFFGLLLEAVQ